MENFFGRNFTLLEPQKSNTKLLPGKKNNKKKAKQSRGAQGALREELAVTPLRHSRG